MSVYIHITNTNRDTALAILSDTKQGLKALKICNGHVTPFRMLIEHMPGFSYSIIDISYAVIYGSNYYHRTDVAEWVLNKCALSGLPNNKVSNNKVTPVPIEDKGTNQGDDQTENNEGSVIQIDGKPSW